MKVYSNILTEDDLRAALPPEVGASIQVIRNPRVARHGYTVYLQGFGPRHTRSVNSGENGAGYHKAATYDDHGEWFARLYAIDPDARLSWWKDRGDFERGTEGKFSLALTH